MELSWKIRLPREEDLGEKGDQGPGDRRVFDDAWGSMRESEHVLRRSPECPTRATSGHAFIHG